MNDSVDPRFDFFEKVTVVGSIARTAPIKGTFGYVGGRAQDPGGRWFYSVFIYELNEAWYVPEQELVSLNEYERPENVSSGIRLPIDARGRLVRESSEPENGRGSMSGF